MRRHGPGNEWMDGWQFLVFGIVMLFVAIELLALR